jgi:hypothetical protein
MYDAIKEGWSADPRSLNASPTIILLCSQKISIVNLFLLLLSISFSHSNTLSHLHTIFSPIYITRFTLTHIDYVKDKFIKRTFP